MGRKSVRAVEALGRRYRVGGGRGGGGREEEAEEEEEEEEEKEPTSVRTLLDGQDGYVRAAGAVGQGKGWGVVRVRQTRFVGGVWVALARRVLPAAGQWRSHSKMWRLRSKM